ncbi:MAG: DSD1 family PLP-dependent enzyme [Burkholderiaceae bacterium]|nr:DSD1 family PLP-dependent enzyme [Burkholderiaceae bacterium]
MSEHEVDTPALIIDLDAFEYNLDRMAQRLAGTGVALRAHAKTHKSPVIAHQQMTRGAVGQCVQKAGEAEMLAWGGVSDILVSNQVVGAAKLARLAALARIARVAVCVDDALQIDALEQAAAQGGVRLTALVEVDAGMGRCGIAPGEPALALARRVADSRHLRFGGIQAYHGSAQHLRTPDERRAAIGIAIGRAADTVDLLKRHGLDCDIVGGAGTGTFELELASGIYTELQAGSYCFMDADYARNRGGESAGFKHALFVLGTVMSQTRSGAAVTDVGHKAVAVDSGLPTVWQRPDIAFTGASDEHGQLSWEAGDGVQLGDKLRLVPGHCDPTVDRYDWYVGVRKGRVECLWPVAARGAFY